MKTKKMISILMAVVMLTLTLSFGVSAQLDTCNCGSCNTSVSYYQWGPTECEILYALASNGNYCYATAVPESGWDTSYYTYSGLNVSVASVTYYYNMYWGDPYVCMWHD